MAKWFFRSLVLFQLGKYATSPVWYTIEGILFPYDYFTNEKYFPYSNLLKCDIIELVKYNAKAVPTGNYFDK